MTSNARCSTPPAIVPLIVMLSLSACATENSDAGLSVCPPVVEYSQSEQERAAAEVETLFPDTVIGGWLADYAVMRDPARACR